MKKRLCFLRLVALSCIMLITVGAVWAEPAQQARTIQGLVSDTKGEPLIGVSVLIKGTSIGVTTDLDGAYTLKGVADGQVLVFTYMGFKGVEQTVAAGQNLVNVIMEDASVELSDVVVVGYGTQKKVSLTGSIATINTTEMQTTSTPSLSNAIAGKMPGIISMQNSGELGYDAAQIYIRGMGTWENRSPLVLVDGVERDMNLINTSEIESFSILKDASATAVYGVRGANGVILINTKKGKIGKPTVTLRSEFAALQPTRLPEYINGGEYAELMNEASRRSGHAERWLPEEIQKFKDGSDPYLYPNVDWLDVVLKPTSFQTINNLNVTGGTERVRYYVNLGFTMQDGLMKEDNLNEYKTNANMKRYSFRSNLDIDLAKNLLLTLGVGGIMDDRVYPGNAGVEIYRSAQRNSPIAFPVKNPDGSVAGISTYIGSNPWAMSTQSGYSIDRHHVIQSNLGLRWDLSSLITKGLSVSGKFSYDLNYTNKVLRNKTYEVKQYLGKDPVTGEDRYNVLREGEPLGYSTMGWANRAVYMEGMINYDRSFGEHNVSAMLLANRREYVDLTASTSIGNIPFRRQGIAGRAAYNYGDRYLVEFNFGRNGSENFPSGKKYGFFPSVAIGWIPTSEAFWNIDFISHLKIRASHGLVGNDQIGGARFLYLTTMNKNAAGYYFGPDMSYYSGIAEQQTGVSSITWEVSRKSNVGLDISFFNNKLNLQVDAFYEKRDGILMRREQLPDFIGLPGGAIPYGNLGKVKNAGIDGMIDFSNTTSYGLSYFVRGNFSFARNVIIENDQAPQKYDYLNTRGHAIDQPWGLEAIGFFESYDDILNSPTQEYMTNVQPGDIKYKDQNDDGVINDYDRVAIGFPRIPEITFGFGGGLGYKGFDVSLYFTGAANASIFIEGQSMYPFMEGNGIFNVLREYYDNRWQNPEQGKTAKYPGVTDDNNLNNYRRSTLWQHDASYLRLRSAEIGYTLPQRWTNKAKINKVRVFANGMNLFTIDKIKIIDPESDNGTGGYPVNRQFNFGLEVTF